MLIRPTNLANYFNFSGQISLTTISINHFLIAKSLYQLITASQMNPMKTIIKALQFHLPSLGFSSVTLLINFINFSYHFRFTTISISNPLIPIINSNFIANSINSSPLTPIIEPRASFFPPASPIESFLVTQ